MWCGCVVWVSVWCGCVVCGVGECVVCVCTLAAGAPPASRVGLRSLSPAQTQMLRCPLRTQPSSVPRCQEERARLQAELEQKQREAERKDAVYEEELGGQRDLVRAIKSRVLELIQ